MIEISEKSLAELLEKDKLLDEKSHDLKIISAVHNESFSRWIELFGMIDEKIVYGYNNIIELYSQPNRYYHNINHILFCLNQLGYIEKYPAYSKEQIAILTWAIWCHDAVYNANSNLNEGFSSKLAIELAEEIGIKSLGEPAAELILFTDHKQVNLTNKTAKYLLDIDLAILGQEPHVFDIYDAQIRAEYIHVPDVDYYPARINVLESFRTRSRIYYTDEFWNKYQLKAEQNLKRTIERYSK